MVIQVELYPYRMDFQCDYHAIAFEVSSIYHSILTLGLHNQLNYVYECVCVCVCVCEYVCFCICVYM